jgi:hypothetical protein
MRPRAMGARMQRILIIIGLSLLSTSAFAAPPNCRSEAAEKHLAGAALASFMGKCERDAKSSCASSAAERRLSGAAKTSFTQKCVNDAVGE